MKLRTIQTFYLLGISLILTGIIYFFAANWGYFDRITKVSLSISLLILFYLIHFLLKRFIKHRPFLSDWSLFAASIVFGVAVALIGQIYNSHADSYQLFLVWLIPVLVLAFMTRYIPFYVLAFILANLLMLLFVFPSVYMPDWSPEILFTFLMMIGMTNAGIFLITYKNWIKSKTILYMAYIMTFSLLLYIATNSGMPIHEIFNVFYGLLLFSTGYFFLKKKQNKGLFTVTVIFAACFLIYRVFYWALSQSGDWIFYVLLLFAAILTLISIVLVGILNRNKMNPYLSNVVIVVITAIATLFATVAITGIFFLIFHEGTADALYFFAIFALILPGLLVKLTPQIRYTLLGTGYIISYITALLSGHVLYEYILLILLGAGIYIVKTRGIKVLLYLFLNVVVYMILIPNYSMHVVFLVIFTLNLAYYIFQRKERSTNYTAFVLVLLNSMNLTFLDLHIGLQVAYNLLFFICVSWIILFVDRKRHRFEWTVGFVLYFVFISYNYYEYLWSLIHKSLAAIVVGGIFIAIATYFERRTSELGSKNKAISYRTSFLVMLIFLQIGFIGIQSFTNEKLLSEGDLIKLELQPVDPRSMLQGDYVILNYKLNDLEIEEEAWNKKIKVLLREKDGIYEYAGNYQMDRKWQKDYEEKPGDVIINGLMQGSRSIVYGIESYFVPEGTGRELETSAKYAYVRVSKSGNALLEKVD